MARTVVVFRLFPVATLIFIMAMITLLTMDIGGVQVTTVVVDPNILFLSYDYDFCEDRSTRASCWHFSALR